MKTILIIEDDRDISKVLETSLKEVGYNVEISFTRTDGLKKLENMI